MQKFNKQHKLVFFNVYKMYIRLKNLKENKNDAGKRGQLLGGWVRGRRGWDPVHRLVGWLMW